MAAMELQVAVVHPASHQDPPGGHLGHRWDIDGEAQLQR